MTLVFAVDLLTLATVHVNELGSEMNCLIALFESTLADLCLYVNSSMSAFSLITLH